MKPDDTIAADRLAHDGPSDSLVAGIAVFGPDHVREWPADHFVGRPAERSLGRRVPDRDGSVEVERHRRSRRGVDECPELGPLGLESPPLRDVLADPDDLDDVARVIRDPVVPDRCDTPQDRPSRAAGGDGRGLEMGRQRVVGHALGKDGAEARPLVGRIEIEDVAADQVAGLPADELREMTVREDDPAVRVEDERGQRQGL